VGAATNRSSDKDSFNMADASVRYVVDGDLKAMQDLANNRSIRGTSASRMAADARSAAAAPGWTSVGADYAAWLRDLWEDPTNPDVAITDGAPEQAYLVVMNRGAHMAVIHHLFWSKASDGGRSRLDGRIVAFEGEILDAHGLPRLWRFAEEEEKLLQHRPLSADILEYATMFYRDGDRDYKFHNRQTPPLQGRGAMVQTCQCLIPIPVGWAHMFLDYPPMGVAYCRLLQFLSATADAAERHHFRAFGEGVALACGSPDPTAPNPISAADSSWKRVAYGKATLSAATAAWEGHRPGASKAPPPGQIREHPPSLTTYLEGQRRRKMILKPGGTAGGTAGPTPHPPMPAPTARRQQCPHRQQCQEVWT